MAIERECIRRDDLLVWLYGEASADETKSFQSHLDVCSQCTEDAEAFRQVRHSVMAWRNESLGSSVIESSFEHATPRSALAAIKQFFDLSPLWMKGAVGLASLLLCVFAVLTVMRMQSDNVAVSQPGRFYSDQELASLVEKRVRQRLEELRPIITPTVKDERDGRLPAIATIRRKPSVIQVTNEREPTRRPLTREERDQLAADLRLISEPGDLDLDLLDDRITRPDE
jgi:hypothetical protein